MPSHKAVHTVHARNNLRGIFTQHPARLVVKIDDHEPTNYGKPDQHRECYAKTHHDSTTATNDANIATSVIQYQTDLPFTDSSAAISSSFQCHFSRTFRVR